MLRKLLYIVALAQIQFALSATAQGQASQSLYLGAGEPGTESFELGVGITSLIKVRLLPFEGIDLTLVETAGQDVSGDLLIVDQEDFAALSGLEPITRSEKPDLRSIMSFRSAASETGQSLELVVRADVPENAVYFLTKSILENAVFLEDLNQKSWDLSADQALTGLSLPIHPGAISYYQEIGEANLSVRSVNVRQPTATNEANTLYNDNVFILDFPSNEKTLDRQAREKIAEACQYAAVFDAPEIRVASSRNGAYDEANSLKNERLSYVLSALRSNAGCADSLEIVASEKPASSPSIDDRIELIIMLPQ